MRRPLDAQAIAGLLVVAGVVLALAAFGIGLWAATR